MLGLKQLFRERPGAPVGKALYGRAVAQARTPAFYLSLGVQDTATGRFELYTLHTILLVLRLKGRPAPAPDVAQALFDAYLEGLDIGLREMGVGDASMGKKMKKLGRAFYGRAANWEAALKNPAEMDGLVRRTVYEDSADVDPAPLAAYARTAFAALREQSDERLLEGHVEWPSPAA